MVTINRGEQSYPDYRVTCLDLYTARQHTRHPWKHHQETTCSIEASSRVDRFNARRRPGTPIIVSTESPKSDCAPSSPHRCRGLCIDALPLILAESIVGLGSQGSVRGMNGSQGWIMGRAVSTVPRVWAAAGGLMGPFPAREAYRHQPPNSPSRDPSSVALGGRSDSGEPYVLRRILNLFSSSPLATADACHWP